MSESHKDYTAHSLGSAQELLLFMRERKSYWLAPVIFVLLMIATLIYFAEGAAVAPFIYTIF
ncbi:MAG: hypothetical protein JSS38_00795 [Nitrospira sp.]|nr:hypothetical protein [Nitrospira sp.]MBS0153106.1 hypothetical protein [Nitrospira sp.]MBS0167183.1 hypothetical protein [Nitrospira sp.]